MFGPDPIHREVDTNEEGEDPGPSFSNLAQTIQVTPRVLRQKSSALKKFGESLTSTTVDGSEILHHLVCLN